MRPKSFFLAAGAAALCILGAAWLWLSQPAAPPASSASSASSGPASSAPGADSEALAQAVSSGNILQSSFKFPFPIPFRSETSAFSCIFAAFCRFNAERLAFRRPKPSVFFAAVYSFRTDPRDGLGDKQTASFADSTLHTLFF